MRFYQWLNELEDRVERHMKNLQTSDRLAELFGARFDKRSIAKHDQTRRQPGILQRQAFVGADTSRFAAGDGDDRSPRVTHHIHALLVFKVVFDIGAIA